MDYSILMAVTVTVILYLASLAVLFRITPNRRIFGRMSAVTVAFGIVAAVFGLNSAGGESMGIQLTVMTAVVLLYGLSALLFIFAVFSVFEASLTVRLLIEIDSAGTGGIRRDEILKRYNRQMIVKKRIERFLASGDLSSNGKELSISPAVSFFRLRESAFRFVRLLFPTR